MITTRTPHKLATLLALAAGLLVSAQADILLIEENFGGSGTDALNGTTADTFNSAITTASGSSTWQAEPDAYKANGDIVKGPDSGSAFLSLGSYINDAKGTANGKFTLTTTIAQPHSNFWVSSGFFNNSASVTGNWTNSGGLATSVNRIDGSTGSDHYQGPGTGGSVFQAGDLTGTVTFTTTLDFTPGGGYDGSSNFGTVTFANSVNSNTFTATYGSDPDWTHVGFSHSLQDSGTSNVSSLQLTQIPESSTVVLLGLALLAAVGLRKRNR